MKTVGDFEKAGLVFVKGDCVLSITGDHESDGADLFIKCIHERAGTNWLSIGENAYAHNDWIPKSFAWRPLNTLPDNPKFKFEYNEGSVRVQWRPLLDQSKKTPYDVAAHVSGEKVKPVFTQEMANAGELPPIGSLFLNETIEVECIAIHNDRVITVSDSVYYSLPSDKCHPIGLTPKQKAVGAALKLFTDGEPIENALSKLYDLWRK